jgi:deoxyhypusine monooxygenase
MFVNSCHRIQSIDHAGFQDSSALLGHELAYCLGQIDDAYALPVLESVLRDENQHPMVRHEVCHRHGLYS